MMRAGRRVQRTEPRCLPVLLVVSAQKSGTTALMGYLLFHPGFAAPQRKEAHFFDRAFAASSRSRASEAGTLDQPPRPKMLARYLSGFARPASRGVAADATPSCMLSRQAMLRAQALLPAARIVVLLRDPVQHEAPPHRRPDAPGRPQHLEHRAGGVSHLSPGHSVGTCRAGRGNKGG